MLFFISFLLSIDRLGNEEDQDDWMTPHTHQPREEVLKEPKTNLRNEDEDDLIHLDLFQPSTP